MNTFYWLNVLLQSIRTRIKTSRKGGEQFKMPDEKQFKKEVQNHKKDYQNKKVELISRLCNEENVKDDKKKKQRA